jgi:hypothetical protein
MLSRPHLTILPLYPELEYIPQVKKVLCSVVTTRNLFGEDVFLIHLNETEERLKQFFIEQGIIFSVRHEILPNKVRFWYNFTSPGFHSESFVECD